MFICYTRQYDINKPCLWDMPAACWSSIISSTAKCPWPILHISQLVPVANSTVGSNTGTKAPQSNATWQTAIITILLEVVWTCQKKLARKPKFVTFDGKFMMVDPNPSQKKRHSCAVCRESIMFSPPDQLWLLDSRYRMFLCAEQPFRCKNTMRLRRISVTKKPWNVHSNTV